MSSVYFISDAGDADLAFDVIDRVLQDQTESVFVVPLTGTALTRAKNSKKLQGREGVFITSLAEITAEQNTLSSDTISDEAIKQVRQFVEKNKIQVVYAGVPSGRNEKPFQIAYAMSCPTYIAYEHMFRPKNHIFWHWMEKLAQKINIEYAIPLEAAREDLLSRHSGAVTHIVGHRSLDSLPAPGDTSAVKKLLEIEPENEFVFVTGTSLPDVEVDNQFLKALLAELSTGNYPHFQIRMGIHPGVKNPDQYLRTLLATLAACAKTYPAIESQFKIILNKDAVSKLHESVPESPFLLYADVSGPAAAAAAERVAQAVPGGLLNEAAWFKKPAVHNGLTASYLPEGWYAENMHAFFGPREEKPEPHTKNELRLTGTAAENMASLLVKR